MNDIMAEEGRAQQLEINAMSSSIQQYFLQMQSTCGEAQSR